MKTFYSKLALFSILFAVGLGISPEERRADEKKILDECNTSIKATEEDMNIILDRGIPQNYNGKCLLACAHEKVGIIVDGEFSIEGLKALGEKEFGNDAKANRILDEIIDECKSINDDDVCEQSAKISDCFIKASVKRGVDPKKGIKESFTSA